MTVIKAYESVGPVEGGSSEMPVEPGAGRKVAVRELLGDEVLDVLLAQSLDASGQLRLTGEGSMLGELVKAVLERALEAELTGHLGYDRHTPGGSKGAGNARNGRIAKTVQTGVGPVPLRVPRDRAGTFEPVLVPKRSGRVAGGLDDTGHTPLDAVQSATAIPTTSARAPCPSTPPRATSTGAASSGRSRPPARPR